MRRRPLRLPPLPMAAAAAALLGACGLLRLEVEHDAATVVPGAGLLGTVLGVVDLGGLDDFDVAVSEELADQGVEPGDLREVRLTRFELTGEPDLGFLRALDVYASADGVAEVLLASVGDVPDGEAVAALRLEDVDLAPLVVAGGMRFRIAASGEAPEEDTDVVASVAAEVVATPQGACNAAN